MDSASCSADEEPAKTWPIVAPLLLLDRAPARGLVPCSSMNLQIRSVKPPLNQHDYETPGRAWRRLRRLPGRAPARPGLFADRMRRDLVLLPYEGPQRP